MCFKNIHWCNFINDKKSTHTTLLLSLSAFFVFAGHYKTCRQHYYFKHTSGRLVVGHPTRQCVLSAQLTQTQYMQWLWLEEGRLHPIGPVLLVRALIGSVYAEKGIAVQTTSKAISLHLPLTKSTLILSG